MKNLLKIWAMVFALMVGGAGVALAADDPIPDFCPRYDFDDGLVYYDYIGTVGEWNYYYYQVHNSDQHGSTSCTEGP